MAYAACRDSSEAECTDVCGDLGEYVCLPETRLLLRATRLCRSEPVFQQPLGKCLDRFEDNCDGIRELQVCLTGAAQSCGSPELGEILSALVDVHRRGSRPECEESRPSSVASIGAGLETSTLPVNESLAGGVELGPGKNGWFYFTLVICSLTILFPYRYVNPTLRYVHMYPMVPAKLLFSYPA